ncbi:MAG: DUF2079 domain-containing protein [Synechococcus sp. SB0669_bin_7]|nr:DUF2079 domain-containing protein [Synechococcus sp. SB0675_bin_7]MYK84924.1 DUF2079 domain-containing protein [Synechococcus sp. SB0669_bin_7]
MVLPGTSSRKPPKAFWLISALLVGLFWGLQALRHTLLHSAGGDLGIYDQVAWQMSQGLEPRSTLLGLHHMGNHGAWMFYAIAPLYRLAPSVQWLFFTQALGLILTAWPLWHLGAQAGLKPREQWLICGLWWLQPVVFNTSFVVDFRPETWAMPLLALAIWANRAEQRWLWLLCLFAMMGCRDGLGLIVIGLALEQACRRRWRWAAEALLLGGGWLLLLTKGLYPVLNNGIGPAALGRYQHLGDGVGDIFRNALFSPAEFLGALDWVNILFYLFLLSLPLAFYWRRCSLPLLMATLPLLMANGLSSWESQQDVVHHYNLPLAVPLVVASMDGLADDLRHDRRWLTRQLWLCYFWATLSWALLAKPGYFFDRYLSRVDKMQTVQEVIAKVPDSSAVLTHDYLVPHLSHRPLIQNPSRKKLPTAEQLARLDIVLLNPGSPGKLNREHVRAIINSIQDSGWSCQEQEKSGQFILCQELIEKTSENDQ